MIRFTAAEGRAVKTFTQVVSDRRYEKLDDKEREVLSLLYEDPGYTVSQMANILNISRKTIAARISRLKEKISLSEQDLLKKDIGK